jgi:hypothetical protein
MAKSSGPNKSRAKRPRRRKGGRSDVDNILGLFIMAFGRGVGHLWVRRETIASIRQTLEGPISEVVLKKDDWNSRWKKASPAVLAMMSRVGNLAAHFAMSSKIPHTRITADDFRSAFAVVNNEHIHISGEWCN